MISLVAIALVFLTSLASARTSPLLMYYQVVGVANFNSFVQELHIKGNTSSTTTLKSTDKVYASYPNPACATDDTYYWAYPNDDGNTNLSIVPLQASEGLKMSYQNYTLALFNNANKTNLLAITSAEQHVAPYEYSFYLLSIDVGSKNVIVMDGLPVLEQDLRASVFDGDNNTLYYMSSSTLFSYSLPSAHTQQAINKIALQCLPITLWISKTHGLISFIRNEANSIQVSAISQKTGECKILFDTKLTGSVSASAYSDELNQIMGWVNGAFTVVDLLKNNIRHVRTPDELTDYSVGNLVF